MLPRRVWNDSEENPEVVRRRLHAQRAGAQVEAAEGAGDRRIAERNQPRPRTGLFGSTIVALTGPSGLNRAKASRVA